MASSVDLPQPDGPAIERYSPFSLNVEVDAGERVRLHFVRHEDLAHPVQPDDPFCAVLHVTPLLPYERGNSLVQSDAVVAVIR
jgi:hypothetical protein